MSDDDVKDAVVRRMAAADVTQYADPSGRQQLWAKCGRCNNWGTVGDMQIGHIEA